jgi:hypothetical protein
MPGIRFRPPVPRVNPIKGSEGLANRNVGARMDAPVYGGQPIEQTLKLREFAQEQAQQLGPEDATKILGEGEEGLPMLLYHRVIGGEEPFKNFILNDYPFLSTGLSKKGMSKWTSPVSPGERVAIGMGKVNKLFDHNNPDHVDDVIEFISKDKQKNADYFYKKYLDEMNPKKIQKEYLHKIKTLDGKIKNKHRFYGKQEVNPAAKHLEPWEIDDYHIYTELPKGHPEGKWWGNTPEQLKEIVKDRQETAKANYDTRFGTTLNTLNQKVFGTYTPQRMGMELRELKKDLRKGDWMTIEDFNIQRALKQLGYDAFTTIESGKNVMLFNPNEQFIPLFDPLKKSTIGFSTGGGLSSLNERV